MGLVMGLVGRCFSYNNWFWSSSLESISDSACCFQKGYGSSAEKLFRCFSTFCELNRSEFSPQAQTRDPLKAQATSSSRTFVSKSKKKLRPVEASGVCPSCLRSKSPVCKRCYLADKDEYNCLVSEYNC